MSPRRKTPTTGPLSIACERCNAKPGKPCTTPRGKPADVPHLIRRNPVRAATQPTGRPGGPTEDVTKQVTDALTLGVPLTTAALNAGIHPSTLHRWLARAESTDDLDAPYREFRDVIARARAAGQVRHVALINQAATRHIKSEEPILDADGKPVYGKNGELLMKRVYEQDWRASSFILERSYGRDFGRREVIELGAADGVEPAIGGGEVAGGGALDGAGVERIVANLAAFRAQKELEAGPAADEPVDAELVEDA